ncbi:site-specific integrase [Geminocystis sp. CENA526]|uniref:site-specific integrase n=1 Tax=Geminocystis sp. CENA526 TaxID=1355871 RepID=UPI003D6EBAF5
MTNKQYKGFQEILGHYELIRKQSPKGISISRKENKLYLQFKTRNKPRSTYAINEPFTISGLNHALDKALLVTEKLNSYESESDFWEWFEENIKQINKNTINDFITIEQAIITVRKDFFNSKDKRGLKRLESCKSDLDSYVRVNEMYFNKLPENKIISYQILYDTLFSYCDDKYQKKFQDCLSAFIRLCKLNNLDKISKKLEKFKISKDKQISEKKIEIQAPLTLSEFLLLREKVINTNNCYQEEREFWLWIFSLQIIYALRLGELLSIKNLDTSYKPSEDKTIKSNDNTLFKAISDTKNKSNYLVIGDFRENKDKTAKTGFKICIPLIPPEYPNLFELLEIKQNIPRFIHRLKNYERHILINHARQNLENWTNKHLHKKITQTHTNRRLGNANGIAMGLPDSLRAKTLGHSIDVNYRYYQNFDSQLIIDLFESSKKHKQPIPFQLAVKLVEQKLQNIPQDETDKIKPLMWELLKDIYQVDLPDYLF